MIETHASTDPLADSAVNPAVDPAVNPGANPGSPAPARNALTESAVMAAVAESALSALPAATTPPVTTASSASSSATPPTPTPRRPLLREHRAFLVIERRDADSAPGDPEHDPVPSAWNWTLANASLARVLDQVLAAAGADLAATIVPEEHAAALSPALLEDLAAAGAPTALVSYNGQLRLQHADLRADPNADPGDRLYFILNGHQFPASDLRLAVAAHRAGRCDVTVFDAPHRRTAKAYDEQLRVDADGHVARVDRLYDAPRGPAHHNPHWPALIVANPAAMRRLAEAPLPHRLDQWPALLVRAGFKVQGATLAGRAFDLHDPDALRELADELLRAHVDWLAAAGNLAPSDHYPKVWVGQNVRIGQNVEFVGPVAIGDHAEIGDDAVVVGPTAIGRNSRVAAGALIRRRILPAQTLFHADAHPGAPAAGAPAAGAPAGATPSALDLLAQPGLGLSPDRLPLRRAGRGHHPIRLQAVLEASSVPRFAGFRHDAYLAVKRAMDVVGALVFLTLTAPFFPLIALAIKLNSPGPVFYGHVRQGRGGRNFRCWKFRTMVVNAEQLKDQFRHKNEVDGPQFKIKDDPRIFFVGKWLRKLNIDEWPQFLNVLLGDMSLVGPRPSPEKENQMCPAWREARLSVRPGITGLWQVSRQRGEETDFQEWIYYDVQYVKKQSIWLDLKILLKTFRVALKGS